MFAVTILGLQKNLMTSVTMFAFNIMAVIFFVKNIRDHILEISVIIIIITFDNVMIIM